MNKKDDKKYKVAELPFPDKIYFETGNIEALRIIKSFVNPKDLMKIVQA